MRKISVIFVLVILLFSPFAYSAGTSEGGSTDRTISNNSNNSLNDTNTTNPGFTRVNCDIAGDLRDRIECRLENRGNFTDSGVPETCRGIEREAGCVALYRSAVGCYNENNSRERKACFLRVAGILQGGTLRLANNEKKGDYVILLLYEVQERIEKMQERGLLTLEEASSLIVKIVEIKQDILNGKKRADIMPKIRELKEMYFNAIQ